jgi:hypothetical protein
MPDQKSHLETYLEYYKSLKNPNYGVLVTGAWGAGKTYQIKSIFPDEEIFYISLFGTQTTDEVYSAVYAKMFPLKSMARKTANTIDGTELDLQIAKFNIGGIVSGIVGAILREQVDADRILVFDDLERSSIPTKDLLSVFNKYIEHHACRVIVIAHDEKISTDLQDTKEKVFGQTIQIIPEISKAFDSFIERLEEPETQMLLRTIKTDILDVFKQSETHSLRILKHTLEDLSRLFEKLSEIHKAKKEAMRELCLLFLALSLEIRSGRLREQDLVDRSGAIIRFQMERSRNAEPSPIPPIYTANERYDRIDLGNRILKDEALINLLIKGIYTRSEIHESLDESLHFARISDLPPWLVFMKFDEVSDIDSNNAAGQLKEQFDRREIDDIGEMLHIFALRFLMAEMGMITANFQQTEADCKEYISDLLERDKLSPNIIDPAYNEYPYAHKGHAFWVEDSYRLNFNMVLEHLAAARSKASKNLYPAIAKDLLKLVSADGALFARKISYTFSGDNTYARIDVLASIDPGEFVQEWMGSSASNWGYISRGLENRYLGIDHNSALKSEKNWLRKVVELLDHQRKNAIGIRKKRIERIVSQPLRDACK